MERQAQRLTDHPATEEPDFGGQGDLLHKATPRRGRGIDSVGKGRPFLQSGGTKYTAGAVTRPPLICRVGPITVSAARRLRMRLASQTTLPPAPACFVKMGRLLQKHPSTSADRGERNGR